MLLLLCNAAGIYYLHLAPLFFVSFPIYFIYIYLFSFVFILLFLQARLSRYLKILYTELALKEPIVPQWAHPTAPGALCPARLEPDFRLHPQSHGFSDCLSVEQLLTPIQVRII